VHLALLKKVKILKKMITADIKPKGMQVNNRSYLSVSSLVENRIKENVLKDNKKTEITEKKYKRKVLRRLDVLNNRNLIE